MLVYIRESDKEKIICNVDEKDVAEHLRVSYLIVDKINLFVSCTQQTTLRFVI